MKIAIDSMGGLITAEEASKKENLAREYKCVNKDCNQKVILCAKESTVVNPYFRVEKGKTHVNNCPYEFIGDIRKYEKEKINIDKFFLNISKISKEKNNERKKEKAELKENKIETPTTLKKMYSYLISLSPNDIIDGKKVIDIIAYCGTEYYYKYDIRGNKIVEGKLIFIDKKNRELKFQFPIYKYAENENKKNKYIIVKINRNIDLSNYEREKNYILCGNFQENKNKKYNSENNKMIVSNRRQIKRLDKN